MTFTESGITEVRTAAVDGGLLLRARSAHSDKVVQCYLGRRLVDVQVAPAEAVEFRLAGVGATDSIRLLAVDLDAAGTDLFDAAFAHDHGNRIRVRTPRTIAPYLPGDTWRVCRGDAGDSEAHTQVRRQDVYPNGRYAGGFGFAFGAGGFGWDGADCAGFGRHFGRGEFGFDCDMLTWESPPLPPGAYPVEVTVVDAAGNESAPSAATVTLDACARPASSLAVQSYDPQTDTLVLTFTPSEDLAS
ncbi:MAG: hypothetical protein ACYS5V_16990 [Planctomycetota bacterium]|jgi:hypothetical protein